MSLVENRLLLMTLKTFMPQIARWLPLRLQDLFDNWIRNWSNNFRYGSKKQTNQIILATKIKKWKIDPKYSDILVKHGKNAEKFAESEL